MPNLEFAVPHVLMSPLGSLTFNEVLTAGSSGGVDNAVFLIEPDGYKIVPTMRVTADNISQQDGSVLHPRFTSGLGATIKVRYAISEDGIYPATVDGGGQVVPACNSDLRLMHEHLILHLQALLTASATPNTSQRLIWFPTGLGDSRLLQAIQTLAWIDPVVGGTGDDDFTYVTFQVESPFPYAIDGTENTPSALTDGGGPVLLPNAGDAPVFPVIRVAGATSSFTITDTDTGEQVVYDGTAIAGGHYAEINFFDGTVYLDGSSTDLGASLTATATDFFQIAPGGSHVEIVGASATVLYNNAYA